MIKVISINVNGIRSAKRKGFFEWIASENPDVVCLQEVRAHMNEEMTKDHILDGYHQYYFDAEKKGYSGVAIYCKKEPDSVETGLGWDIADKEGRYIQINYPKLTIGSLYMPSGTSGEGRQEIKYDFLDHYLKVLKKHLKEKREFILCGDWNIAHKIIDIKNWKSNQNTSGFLPEERAWMDKIFDEVGYIDAFRVLNQKPDQYTWWSQRSRAAYANNVGWRIDYHVVTPGLKDKIKSVDIYKGQKFSDHAPVIIEYNVDIG